MLAAVTDTHLVRFGITIPGWPHTLLARTLAPRSWDATVASIAVGEGRGEGGGGLDTPPPPPQPPLPQLSIWGAAVAAGTGALVSLLPGVTNRSMRLDTSAERARRTVVVAGAMLAACFLVVLPATSAALGQVEEGGEEGRVMP